MQDRVQDNHRAGNEDLKPLPGFLPGPRVPEPQSLIWKMRVVIFAIQGGCKD